MPEVRDPCAPCAALAVQLARPRQGERWPAACALAGCLAVCSSSAGLRCLSRAGACTAPTLGAVLGRRTR